MPTAPRYYFHRGMDGDRNAAAGGSYAANITLSDATTRLDSNWLAGQNVESRRLTSASVAKTRTVNWFSATLTAGSGNSGAYFVATQKSEATTYGTANKITRTEYVYDTYGNLTYENQYGDTAITTDDRTVQRGYLANTGAYIVDRLAWQKLWAGIVTAAAPGTAGQEKAYSEFAYDNQAYGANPTAGNATKLRTYWQATPSYQSYESTTTYDAYGRPTSSTDGRGNSTTTAYDATYGYASSVTNDLGHVTQSAVDPRWGVATQVTDANNKITTLQYDNYGRLSKVWLPSEPTSGVASYEFSYSVTTRPAWVKSRQLRVKASSSYLDNWSFVDGQGRTLQSQTPDATGSNKIVTSQNYNNLGQLVYSSVPYQLTGAAGTHSQPTWSGIVHYHQFYYDELGRMTKDETRATTTIQWDVITTYDGWLQKRYDANNTATTNNIGRSDALYNAFGQLSSVVEYNGAASYTTNYDYDLLGNLTGVTDHLGNITSMSYDLLGRKTAMTDPDMGSWQYQYDAVGNLTGQRDARNQWLYLEYDDLNRQSKKRRDTAVTGLLLAEYLYDAVGQKGLPTSSKAYNAAGNTVEVEIQSAAYDSRNRLTQQNWVVNGVGTFRLDSGFNEANQQTSLTYPGGTAAQQGEAVTYGYNAIGQLTSVSGLLGIQYVSSATYNAQGQMTQLRNDSGVNGLTRVWTYTASTQRLSVMQAGTNATTYDNLQKLTYTYDSAGNVKTVLDTRNASQKQCFGYDGLYRLTSAYTTSSANTCTGYVATGTANYNHTYTYNEVGNITSYAGNAYTYGDTAHKHAVTAAFGNSYGYDANGNQTTRTVGGVTTPSPTTTKTASPPSVVAAPQPPLSTMPAGSGSREP